MGENSAAKTCQNNFLNLLPIWDRSARAVTDDCFKFHNSCRPDFRIVNVLAFFFGKGVTGLTDGYQENAL